MTTFIQHNVLVSWSMISFTKNSLAINQGSSPCIRSKVILHCFFFNREKTSCAVHTREIAASFLILAQSIELTRSAVENHGQYRHIHSFLLNQQKPVATQNNFSNCSMPGRSPYFHAKSQQEQRAQSEATIKERGRYSAMLCVF